MRKGFFLLCILMSFMSVSALSSTKHLETEDSSKVIRVGYPAFNWSLFLAYLPVTMSSAYCLP